MGPRAGYRSIPRIASAASTASAAHSANSPDEGDTAASHADRFGRSNQDLEFGADRSISAAVMADLEAIREMNPDEAQRLIADREKMKPSIWAGLVKQRRALLAYQRRVAQQEQPAETTESDRASIAQSGDSPQNRVKLSHDVGPSEPRGGETQYSALQTTTAPNRIAPAPGDHTLSAIPTEQYAAFDSQQLIQSQQANTQPPSNPMRTPQAASGPVGFAAQSGPAATSVAPGSTTAANTEQTYAAGAGVSAPGTGVSVSGVAQVNHLAPAGPVAPLPGAGLNPQDQLAAAIHAIERQSGAAEQSPEAAQQQAALRLLYLAAGRPNDAMRPLMGVSPAQQDFWSSQMFGLATYLDEGRIDDSDRRAAEAKRHLTKAVNKLGQLGALTVNNLALCTKVTSFGVYDTFDPAVFAPGDEVLLYAEVENFLSEPTNDGFHTTLSSRYEILDSRGQTVAEDEFPVVDDYCRNVRRDFFVRYFVRLPTNVPDGKYTLQLLVEDTKSEKLGQSSVSLEIRQQVKK